MKFIDFLIKNNIHELILFIIIGLTIYIIIKKSLSTNQEKINRKQQTIKKLIINISKYTIIIFLILKLLTILQKQGAIIGIILILLNTACLKCCL